MILFSQINFAAVVVAAVAAIAIGSIWFGPRTFFPVWWKAMGRSADEKPGGENMGIVFAGTFVGQFTQAFAVSIVMAWFAASNGGMVSFGDALVVGLVLGVGLAAAASLSHRLFAGQSFTVWLLEVGNDIVGITVMAIIIGLWR